MSGILEINDVALRMYSPEGEDIIEPGYALIDTDGGLLLGNAALEKSRINPPRTENDFWHWMDTQPIKAAARNYQHNADLVFAQLEDLYRRSGVNRELNLLVPSNYTPDQLSMLLGIAQHAGVEIRQVYDAALASSINHAGPGIQRLVYTDIYLHHCVITQLARVGDELSVAEFRVVPGAGLLNFFDAWLHGIADLFVRGSRFDPLHDAVTEQKAFDQIYAYYLNTNADGRARPDRLTIELENRHIELSRQQFSAMGESIYRKIQGVAESLDVSKDANRLISDRVARLPGWQEFVDAAPLPADSAIAGILEHEQDADGEGVGYITSLALPAGQSGEGVAAVGNVTVSTHLLCGAEALPLNPTVTYLEPSTSGVRLRSNRTPEVMASIENTGNGHQLKVIREGELSINGKAVNSATLGAGDLIRVDSSGVELVMIRVRGDGAH
jgi:hypothetical protein